jgi:hypothetical protein
MAFFLEAAARTALLLQASEFGHDYRQWIDSVKPKLLSAAWWMVKNETRGMKGDARYTHRYYLNADAIGFVGLLNHDQDLIENSKKLIREGIAKQSPEGFNPEKEGHDTSDHAVGLLFALRYYTILADEHTRKEMEPMIVKGLQWLNGRIHEDGSVDQTGNTRTGLGQEVGRDNKLKTMGYGSAARALDYWSQITGDQSFEEVAWTLSLWQSSSALINR